MQEGGMTVYVEMSVRTEAGVPVVVLRGELDLMDACATAAAVVTVSGRRRPVVVDLSALEFIDCCAACALLRARGVARQGGGDVLLAGPQGSVLRLLTLTGLAGVFDVYASAAPPPQLRLRPA